MLVEQKKAQSLTLPGTVCETEIGAFRAELECLTSGKDGVIHLDCSKLKQPTSGLVAVLWDAHNSCVDAGKGVSLTNVGPGLEKVLKVLDLYDYLVGGEHAESLSPEDKTLAHYPTLSLEVILTAEGVESAIDRFCAFLRGLNLSGSLSFELRTVVYEVLTNVRLHASLPLGAKALLSMQANEEGVTLEFEDSGKPFDPSSFEDEFDPRRALKKRQKRGLGITMIKRLVDKIDYHRVNNEFNRLILQKDYSSGEDGWEYDIE